MASSHHINGSAREQRDSSSLGLPPWGAWLAGGALAALGLSRRSKFGVALAAAGGALVYSGVKNYNAEALSPIVATSLVINCSPQDAYRMWRDFEKLPLFMNHLESVTALDERRSKWVAVTPLGIKLQWNAEIDTDRAGELISWHSLPGSDIQVSGSVAFRPAPANRGTLLVVALEYRPGGRATSRPLISLLGKKPSFFLRHDLRRFKALLETGEIPTTEGQSHGPRSRIAAIARAMDPTEPIRGEAKLTEVMRARRRAS